MKLTLKRYSDNNESTLGLLFIDGKFECYTLEDIYRDVKVSGKTRIPSGIYQIKLRNEGGMTKHYGNLYDFHKGMLWLQNVPNFSYVYIHIGNEAKNTEGCILVANTANNNQIEKKGFIGQSTPAYEKLYKKVSKSISNGDYTYIEIIDEV